MRSIEWYLNWLNNDPAHRMIIVPGIHLANEIRDAYDLESDQILDMYSLTHYDYPEYEGKSLAFYNYPVCIADMLNTRYNVVDLESRGQAD